MSGRATSASIPMAQDGMTTKAAQRRANVRLALILASVAAVLAVGFVAKVAFLGPN